MNKILASNKLKLNKNQRYDKPQTFFFSCSRSKRQEKYESKDQSNYRICSVDQIRLPAELEVLLPGEDLVDQLAVEHGDLGPELPQFF